MKKSGNPAIVLGGGATTGLGAIRSLGRAGVTTYFMDNKKSEAIYSKFCRKCFVSPKMGHSKKEMKRILLGLQHQIGENAVLFPATDLFALTLSDLMDELKGYFLPAPRKEVLMTMIYKKKFYRSLIRAKIPHPTTHFPENTNDARTVSRKLTYPVLIKPSISHSFSAQFHAKGFVANSEEELLSYWTFLEKGRVDVMIQEIVPGPPVSHVFLDGYFNKQSNPMASFARQRLRMWPEVFGNSSSCVSIPISEITPLKDTLFKYLRSLSYCGIFSAEFKQDQRDGVFKLLEINSRTSAWFNTLSAKCGVNLMLFAYLDAIGEEIEYSEDYEAGVKWIFLKDDLRSSFRMVIKGHLTIQKWISSLQGEKDFMLYARDDPKPFLMSLPQVVFAIKGT